MEMDSVHQSKPNETQGAEDKKNIDIGRILNQMGIHPDQWLYLKKEKEG